MRNPITKLFAVVAIAASAFMFPAGADAQKGEKVLGIAGGYASYNDGGYADIYFQYTFADHFRIAPEIGYVFRNEGATGFEMSVDMHFPFRIVRGFGVYPLAGVTFNNWSYKGDGHASRAGFDIGAGFDLYLTRNLKLNLQGKYSMMNDTGGAFFNLGIGYVF